MVEIQTAPHVARRLADALEKAGVPYAIGGAIAYGLHAPPRATNDVDINVFVEPDGLDPVFDTFERAGATVDRVLAGKSARERGDFKVRVGNMRVDVFVPSVEIYESASKRARNAVLLGRQIKVLSAEDLAVFKLLFFRPKDVSDVERLVAYRGAALDREYVRDWLVRLAGAEDQRVACWDNMVREADRIRPAGA